MVQQAFIKDQEFILSAPADYGIQPPDGKTPGDFLGWRGCDPTELTSVCLGSDLEKTLSAGSRVKYTDITRIPCYYPVWNKYGWAQDQLSTEFYITYADLADRYRCRTNFTSTKYATKNTINYYNDEGYDTLAYISSGNVICEGGKVSFAVCNSPGKQVNNVYLNGRLFAGISVDAEYWTAHKGDLYGLLDDRLSSNFCKSKPLSVENDFWMLMFNMTSCHVSSDGLMHISCDVKTMGGSVNLYESLEESL